MLVTGAVNTLTNKAADIQTADNRYGELNVAFNHPFVQAAAMFMGEMLCLLAYFLLRWRSKSKGEKLPETKKFSPFIFVLPALCDLTATSTMYVALVLTNTSSFQMLRAAVVVFTSILSMIFLKRKIKMYQWFGVSMVVLGTVVVGLESFVCSDSSSSASNPLLGNALIVAAQVVVAVQMVVEEKFIGGYDVPALMVVGLEGVFGFLLITALIVIFYFVPNPSFLCTSAVDCNHFEDALDAFYMIGKNYKIGLFIGFNVFSIAFFNYFGVSVTKHINSATRMVLDSLRTIVVWGFSLAIGWENFCYINIIGFAVLAFGTVVYNGIVKLPKFNYDAPASAPRSQEEEAKKLLDEQLLAVDDGRAYEIEATATPVIGPSFDVYNTPTLSKARMVHGK